jgi:hypothetical protein
VTTPPPERATQRREAIEEGSRRIARSFPQRQSAQQTVLNNCHRRLLFSLAAFSFYILTTIGRHRQRRVVLRVAFFAP